MHHEVDALKGAPQTSRVADVADEVAQTGVIEACLAHLMLFLLVAAEHDQLGRLVFLQHHLDKFLSKRTGTAGHQNDFILPIHFLSDPVQKYFCFFYYALFFVKVIRGYWPFSPK